MSTIAIGDIHGNLAALADLLARVGPRVTTDDFVVFLGDYIDRGPDSKGCIDAILEFRRRVPAEVVCLRGNHEDWMLRTAQDYTRHSWLLGMDAFATIESYSPAAADGLRQAMREAGLSLYVGRCELPYRLFFEAMPPEHRKFFDELALCHETADCICTHAGLNPAEPALAAQSPADLVWGHESWPAGYRGDRPVVYGHWRCTEVDPEGWPRLRITGRTFGIDTIAQGVLTALYLPENGIVRSGRHPC